VGDELFVEAGSTGDGVDPGAGEAPLAELVEGGGEDALAAALGISLSTRRYHPDG
jgi:hypothetical protein